MSEMMMCQANDNTENVDQRHWNWHRTLVMMATRL